MSAASPAAMLASGRPVAGFSVTNVSPDSASRNSPLMNAFVRIAGNAATAMERLLSTLSIPRDGEYGAGGSIRLQPERNAALTDERRAGRRSRPAAAGAGRVRG